MCCRFSPLFMSKSPFFGQLPMAKLYAWKREAEGQTGAQPMCRQVWGERLAAGSQLCSLRPGCSQVRRGSAFTVFGADPCNRPCSSSPGAACTKHPHPGQSHLMLLTEDVSRTCPGASYG